MKPFCSTTAILFLLMPAVFGISLSVPAFAEDEESKRPEPPLRSFDVRATSTASYFIDGDKVKEEDAGDQVVYFVDLPNKIVKRVAVYYAQKKKKKGEAVVASGLHAEPIEYAVVHYKFDFMRDQLLIKALAQTQNNDGFETLVIGEDFVASSVSTKGYFTVTNYERTDAEAIAFKRNHGKIDEEPVEETSQPERSYRSEDGDASAAQWVSGKIQNFNRWRRQKVRSSYTD
ncbi:MAG: hypothetical protein KBC91_00450 [Candidatus Omnitrophica bacterium]|nr:hypothetical protein [Candidatus Omnitrophota bacterium]